MDTAEKIEPGVYRAPSGHTIVINKNHPDDMGVPDGYERLGTEAEFAEGRFHPYAMPGKEPEGWTPETASHGGGQWATGDVPPAGAGGASPEDVDKAVADALAAQSKDFDAKLKKALDAQKADLSKQLEAAAAKAVEAATK